jgi:CRP-like cAMP-binding protein
LYAVEDKSNEKTKNALPAGSAENHQEDCRGGVGSGASPPAGFSERQSQAQEIPVAGQNAREAALSRSFAHCGQKAMIPSQKRVSRNAPRNNIVFDAKAFLDSAGIGRKIKKVNREDVVYSQGEAANTVIYLNEGSVKLTVVNGAGKEAVITIIGPGDFFGEGCLAGQSVRMGTATAITESTVHVIEKGEMLKVLHEQHALSDQFIAFMLARNIRVEEDLIDQLFNSSEKRLARTLLLLARYGKEDQLHGALPPISQEMLAEMIGTTRPRVNFFMNKFKKLGFIKYDGGLKVNASLLSVVLHD